MSFELWKKYRSNADRTDRTIGTQYNYLVVLITIILLSVTACQEPVANKKETVAADTGKDKIYVAVKTFETEAGWGYAIYTDNKLYIQQPFIPGVSGKHGFASQKDAQKAGGLVFRKMRQQQRFPVISRKELQEVGIMLP